MKRFVFVLLLCLFSGGVAVALEEDGYVFNEGYWWKDGVAYSRNKEYYGYVSYYGYSYPRYYYYSYTPAVANINPQALDADAKLLDIAAARDRTEGKVRLANQKHAAFLEKVDKLGLAGNFSWQGYGAAIPGPAYGNKSLFYGSYGFNGNTPYGYTYNQVADLYGTLDPNVLFQQSASLTKGAQGLAGQANTEFNNLLKTATDGMNRAAEIREQGIAAERVLNASKAAPQAKVITQGSGVGTAPAQSQPQGVIALPNAAQATRNALCASCHSAQNKKGGFDVTKWGELTPDQKMYVVNIVTTADEKHRMPRKEDGGVGPKVTLQQLEAFLKP